MMDIQALRTLFDDDALIRKYISRFIEDMPGLIHKMRKACEDRMWDELSIYAHSYKSQMQYLNESTAADTALEVEKISTFPDPEAEKIQTLILHLEDHLNGLLPALKQLSV